MTEIVETPKKTWVSLAGRLFVGDDDLSGGDKPKKTGDITNQSSINIERVAENNWQSVDSIETAGGTISRADNWTFVDSTATPSTGYNIVVDDIQTNGESGDDVRIDFEVKMPDGTSKIVGEVSTRDGLKSKNFNDIDFKKGLVDQARGIAPSAVEAKEKPKKDNPSNSSDLFRDAMSPHNRATDRRLEAWSQMAKAEKSEGDAEAERQRSEDEGHRTGHNKYMKWLNEQLESVGAGGGKSLNGLRGQKLPEPSTISTDPIIADPTIDNGGAKPPKAEEIIPIVESVPVQEEEPNKGGMVDLTQQLEPETVADETTPLTSDSTGEKSPVTPDLSDDSITIDQPVVNPPVVPDTPLSTESAPLIPPKDEASLPTEAPITPESLTREPEIMVPETSGTVTVPEVGMPAAPLATDEAVPVAETTIEPPSEPVAVTPEKRKNWLKQIFSFGKNPNSAQIGGIGKNLYQQEETEASQAAKAEAKHAPEKVRPKE